LGDPNQKRRTKEIVFEGQRKTDFKLFKKIQGSKVSQFTFPVNPVSFWV